MKVWIVGRVYHPNGADKGIHKVFDSAEKARSYLKDNDYHQLNELKLEFDEIISDMIYYILEMEVK